MSRQDEWYSWAHSPSFLNFWYLANSSKHIEQEVSPVSLFFIHMRSGILAIYEGVKPLLILPLFSSSSIIYSYVMLSISGRVGSTHSALLSSMALWSRRSSSAAALFPPSILFIITYIIISRSRFLASYYYIYIANYIWATDSLFGLGSPAFLSSALLKAGFNSLWSTGLDLLSALFFSLYLSSTSISFALKSKFFFLKPVISRYCDSIF